MEYYIITTRKCNLRCRYCYETLRTFKEIEPTYTVKELVDFIVNTEAMKQAMGDNLEEARVVFYGGEPLLNIPFLEECLRYPAPIPIRFVLNTNGTRLNLASDVILERLSAMLISVDGSEYVTDLHRGQGVCKAIMKNFALLPKRLQENTIARITLTILDNSSVYEAVTSLMPPFKNVYWQLESLPQAPSNWQEFLIRYRYDITRLLERWVAKMVETGEVDGIIPFQALVTNLVLGKKEKTLRCACGSNLTYIDPKGNCYLCDELSNNERFKIGDIYNGIIFDNEYFCRMKGVCASCVERYICGGRCLSCFSREHAPFEFYCEATKLIIAEVNNFVPHIKELLRRGIITESKINSSSITYTEEIP